MEFHLSFFLKSFSWYLRRRSWRINSTFTWTYWWFNTSSIFTRWKSIVQWCKKSRLEYFLFWAFLFESKNELFLGRNHFLLGYSKSGRSSRYLFSSCRYESANLFWFWSVRWVKFLIREINEICSFILTYRSFTQLMTGNTNGHVSGWNLKENNNSNNSVPDIEFLAHEDCTNGIR